TRRCAFCNYESPSHQTSETSTSPVQSNYQQPPSSNQTPPTRSQPTPYPPSANPSTFPIHPPKHAHLPNRPFPSPSTPFPPPNPANRHAAGNHRCKTESSSRAAVRLWGP